MKEILYFFFLNLGWGMLATTLLVSPQRIGRSFYALNSLCALGLWIAAMVLRSGGDLGALNMWIAGAAGALMLSFMLDPSTSPRPALVFYGLSLALVAVGYAQELGALTSDAYYTSRPFLALSFLSSSLLVGGTMVAMILGHFYLVTPGLSFGLLGRFTKLIGALLLLRFTVALLPILAGRAFDRPTGADESIFFIDHLVFLLQRGLALVALAVLVPMIWDCVKRQANQSATGLLYVAAFLALMGEGVATYFAVAYHLPI